MDLLMMDLPARLEPVLAGLGYELVMLERAGRGLVRIFIDKPGGKSTSRQRPSLNRLQNLRDEVPMPCPSRPLIAVHAHRRNPPQAADCR